MSEPTGTPKTWRVRGIDPHCSRACLREMAAAQGPATAHLVAPTIRVPSLALEPHRLSQTATVTFSNPTNSREPPSPLRPCVEHSCQQHEEQSRGPTIDEAFLGLTTLYAPSPQDHLVDVIAISGLGGHALGSFKERKGEHMWLRDALLGHLLAPDQAEKETKSSTGHPMARIMIYGYSSQVPNSNSVQNIDDLASQLRQELSALCAQRTSGPESVPRPIIIISHSLGGLVVKETIISIVASKEAGIERLRSSISGLIFFGVPHLGMDIASILQMTGLEGPNKELVLSIGQSNSHFLNRQAREFSAALSKLGGPQKPTEVFCFYETAQSPTAACKDGKWTMSGSWAVLVSVPSATHCVPQEDRRDHTCAINRSHSDIVKYAPNDHVYNVVRHKIQALAERAIDRQVDICDLQSASPPVKVTRIIPMSRNTKFTGRTSVLKRLGSICFPDGTGSNDRGTVALVSLGGLGGIGKTQVALEFSYWVQDNMPEYSIFWVSALSMDTFRQSCSEILDGLGLPSEPGNQDSNDMKRLKDYLSTSPAAGKWLLIVDNADDVELVKEIRRYLPQSSTGITLVTTRNEEAAWQMSSSPSLVSLDVMSEDEARHLLKRLLLVERVPDQRDGLCDKLLEALEMLPLAITQAAASLNQNQISIQDYLDLLHGREEEARRLLGFQATSAEEWPAEKQQKTQYKAAMTTWLVSLEQIQRDESGASTTTGRGPTVELLMFLSRVEPKAIPKRMLPQVGDSAVVLTNTIGTLLRYALLTKREGEVYDMHSLVHLAIRCWVDQQQLTAEATSMALECLRSRMHFEDYLARSSHVVWAEYLPHALRVLTDSVSSQPGTRIWLADDVSKCLNVNGRFDDALRWMVVYVEDVAAVYGSGSYEHAKVQCNLAAAHLNAGRFADGLCVAEAAVASLRKTVPVDDEWLIDAQVQHGRALQGLGQAQQAAKLLGKLASQLGTKHPGWADVHNNLADSYRLIGEYDRAIPIYTQVLETTQSSLPLDHYQRTNAEHRLALAYLGTGKSASAIPLLRHVLAVYEVRHPVHHYNFLVAQQALAQALAGIGEPAQALAILQHVVEQNNKTLVLQDTDRLNSQYWLATAWLAIAKPGEAIVLLKDNIQHYPNATTRENQKKRSHLTLLRDVYEALGDHDNVARLERMIQEIDTWIAKQPETLEAEYPEDESSDEASSADGQPEDGQPEGHLDRRRSSPRTPEDSIRLQSRSDRVRAWLRRHKLT